MLDDEHFDYLVSAAFAFQIVDGRHADDLSEMLRAENARSVSYRYPGYTGNPSPTPPRVLRRPRITRSIFSGNPVAELSKLIKQCHCYEYQACEHPEWEGSAARKFVRRIEREAIRRLPGYEAAPWGITRESAAQEVVA
jgi:hypothetical protein